MSAFFDHEKLEVYQLAIRFVVIADQIIQDFPRGKSYLADQLQRAGSSIPLNIAEGAGEFSQNEKSRFYRIAKRSATECSSILDICEQLKLVQDTILSDGRSILLRIVSMLVRLAK